MKIAEKMKSFFDDVENSIYRCIYKCDLLPKSDYSPKAMKTLCTLFSSTNGKSAVFALLCCILIRAVTGIEYVFGNLLPYLASYIASQRNNNAEDYEYFSKQCSWIYTASIIPSNCACLLGGKMEQKIGMRPTTMIGLITMNVGIASSYFTCHSFWGLLISYGLVTGTGVGITFTMPILCAMRWWPNNKGFVNGIISFAFGITGIIFNPLSTYFINPQNKSIDPDTGFLNEADVLNNIPSYFYKMALIYFSVGMLSMIYFKNPSIEYENVKDIDMRLIKDGDDVCEQNDETTKLSKGGCEESDCSLICKWLFMNLWITYLLKMTVAPFINSQWKEFNNQQLGISNDYLLSLMASAASVSNSISRLFWPIIYDYLPHKSAYFICMAIMSIASTIFLSTWPFIDQIEIISVDILSFIWLSALYLFRTGMFPIFSTYIAALYGIDRTAVLYGYLSFANVLSQLIGMTMIIQIQSEIGWIGLNVVMSIISFIMTVFVFLSKCQRTKSRF